MVFGKVVISAQEETRLRDFGDAISAGVDALWAQAALGPYVIFK